MTLADDLRQIAQSAGAALTPEHRHLLDLKLQWLQTSGLVGAALRRGELVPDFALPDARGGSIALSALLDRGPTALLFHCGSWCKVCDAALAAYARIADDVAGAGGSLVAISPVRQQPATAVVDNGGWPGVMLWDEDGKICKLFGLLYVIPAPLVRMYRRRGIDLPSGSARGRWLLPLPATYVVDGNAIAVFAHVDADHTRRAEPATVVKAMRSLATAADDAGERR
jgi:peroxiredoxin